MKTFTITKKHLCREGSYIGTVDLTQYGGNVRISGKLGEIYIKTPVNVLGNFAADSGTSVLVGGTLQAGGCINIGGNLGSLGHIHAQNFIGADGHISAEDDIVSIEGGIHAKKFLSAGGSIFCNNEIFAYEYIAVVGDLRGESITAFTSEIFVNGTIESRYTICAGKDIQCDQNVVSLYGEVRAKRNIKVGYNIIVPFHDVSAREAIMIEGNAIVGKKLDAPTVVVRGKKLDKTGFDVVPKTT